MYLKHLSIKYFRNYFDHQVDFFPGVNIFYGPNGQGKTNLLEAIYYLLATNSFRTVHDCEMVMICQDHFYLMGLLNNQHGEERLDAAFQPAVGLKIKLNTIPVSRVSYAFKFPVVVFSPGDLLLIKGNPAVRRRFLNLEGSRLKPRYLNLLREYTRILQQRNSILRKYRHLRPFRDILVPWNETLIKTGSALIKQRISLLKRLEEQGALFYSQLTLGSESFSLKYSCSFDLGAEEDGEIERRFNDRLSKVLHLELKKGYTMAGPHLDDFRVLINNQEAKKYSSQGQQRSAALALKMAEAKLFEYLNLETPIILLDDLFSEFDSYRRQQLLNFLMARSAQSFITMNSPPGTIFKNPAGIYRAFHIEGGNSAIESDRSDS